MPVPIDLAAVTERALTPALGPVRVTLGDRLPSGDLTWCGEPGAEHNVTIRAVTWAQVLQDARLRLGFVRDFLAYTSTIDASMSYLRRVHGKYLPSSAAESEAADAAPDTPEAAAAECALRQSPVQRCAGWDAHRAGRT